MKNEMQIFENPEFGSVRTVEIDGEPWFVGKDVATALGYANTADAIQKHVDNDDKLESQIAISGQNRKIIVINEAGLYSLVLSSKLPSAKKFKKWVTSKVLPSIRKHGMYAEDELLDNPDLLIKVAQALKEEREKNKALEEKVEDLEISVHNMNEVIGKLEPKANYVDIILKSPSTVLTTQIAQDYGVSARKFNKTLSELRIQRKVGNQWILYAEYLGEGYTHSRTIDIVRSNGQPDVKMQTEWTQKGRLFLYEELKKHGIYPTIERTMK